jgi:hypothetical protein
MTNPTKYFINSGMGTFIEWSSAGTPGSDILGKEAVVVGGSGVDWAYVQAGASMDFSDTGGGPDLLYLTGKFSDYLQAGPDEFGVYSFSRTVLGKSEVIKFSSTTDADVIYFADGHVVLKADEVQSSGTSLQDQDTGEFRPIVSGDLLTGGAPSYPFTSLPVVDSVAVKTFINDLGGITVPSLPVAGASSVVFGSSGTDVIYVREGTSVDFSDAGGGNDLLYLTGKFADYTQSGPDEFGVYTFARVISGKTETVRFASTTDSDAIYFADGHVVMKADDIQASGTSLQDQDTGEYRQILLADLNSPGNPHLSKIASATITQVADNLAEGTTASNLAAGASTNDTTLDLSGAITTPLGTTEQVVVYATIGGTTTRLGVATATVGASSWNFTTSTLAKGDVQFTVRVEDTATATKGEASNPWLQKIQAIAISGMSDNVGAAQGQVVIGGASDDLTPTMTGTLSTPLGTGEEVAIYASLGGANPIKLGVATAVGANWSFTPSADLAAGSYVFTGVVQVAGNSNIANASVISANYNVALVSPSAVLGANVASVIVKDNSVDVTTYYINAGLPVVGEAIASGTSTDDATPVISGTYTGTLGANEIIRVYNNGAYLGDASPITSNNTWSFVPAVAMSSLGANTFSAKVVNTVIDLHGTEVSDSVVINSFSINYNNVNQMLSGVLGSAIDNTKERLFLYKGSTRVGPITVASDLSWSMNLSAFDGTLDTYIVTLENLAGTTVQLARSMNIAVGSAEPHILTFNMSDDSSVTKAYVTNATGTFNSGTSTDDTTPALSGTYSGILTGSQTIRIYDNGAYLNTATVDTTSKSWAYTPPMLTKGSHVFSAKIYDSVTAKADAGLSSTALIQTMDTFSPIPDNATLVKTVTVSQTGRYVMVARQGDSLNPFSIGEIEVMSGGLNVALGKTATGFSGSSAFKAVDGVITTAYSTSAISLPSVMQWWQVDLGADYAVDSINFSASTVVAQGANSTIFLTSTSVGSLKAKGSITAASNTAGVVIYGTTPDVAGTSTFKLTAIATADNTPTLTGKLATGLQAGEVLAVYDGITLLGDATVAPDGTWNLVHKGPAMSSGAHTIIAKVQDATHTSTQLAQSYELQVMDVPAPTAAVKTLVVTDDSSATKSIDLSANAAGILSTGTSTDDVTPTLSGTYTGTLAYGEKIQVFDNGVFLGDASSVDTVNNTWIYYTVSPLSTGSHEFTAKAVNPLSAAAQTANIPSSTAIIQSMDALGVLPDNGTSAQSVPMSKTARYVMIARQGDGTVLAFKEVEIMSGGLNVALGKTATNYISSTTFKAERAVDGVSTSYYSSFSGANADAMQWWQVDLGADYAIDSIKYSPIAIAPAGGGYIFLAPSSVGSLSGLGSVDAVMATVGVLNYGKTPRSYSDSTYTASALATADSTPTLTGKLAQGLQAGEVLAIYDDQALLGDATVAADGSWIFVHTGSALSVGTHLITAKLQDTAHTTTKLAKSYDFQVLDVSAPLAAVTGLVVLDDSSDTKNIGLTSNAIGLVGTGASTDDATPVIKGTYSGTLAGGERIQVFDNGILLGSASSVDTINHTWAYNVVNPLIAGSHVFTAKAVNTLSTSAQTANVPSTTALIQTMGSFGLVADNGTAVETLPISRTARYVLIARQGNGVSRLLFNEVEVISNGNNVALGKTATAYAQNSNTASRAVDGSTSTYYDSSTTESSLVVQWWQLDLGADYAIDSINFTPNNLGLSSNVDILLSSASVGSLTGKSSVAAAMNTSGVVHYGRVPLSDSPTTYTASALATADTTPTLTGKLGAALLAGERLAIFSADDTYLGNANVASDGSWTYLVASPLANGVNNLRIKLQDSAGGDTRLESLFEVCIISSDVPTAAVSSLVVNDDSGAKAGNAYSINAAAAVAQGTSTDDTTPTISGSLSKPLDFAEIVQVYDGSKLLGKATVTGNTWSFAPSTPLDMGIHSLTARVENSVTDLFSPFVGVPVSLHVSSLGWNTLVANSGDIQGNLMASGNSDTTLVTIDSSLELAGVLGAEIDPAKERLAVYDGGVLLGNASVTGKLWSYAASGLSLGIHTLEVRLENLSTGVASLARAQNVQIVNPGAIPSTVVATIFVADDSNTTSSGSLYKAGNATGTVATSSSTDDATPTVSGGLSALLTSGEVVQVFDGNKYLGAATVNGSNWTFTPTALNALTTGTHTLNARVINASSGNASTSLGTTVAVQSMTDFSVTPQGGTAKGGQFVRYVMVHQGAVTSPEVFDVGFIKIVGVNDTLLSDLPGISWSTSDTSKVPVSINGSSNPQYKFTYNPRYPEMGYTTATATTGAWIQVDLGAAYELSSITLGNVDAGAAVFVSTQSMSSTPALSALQSGTHGATSMGDVSSTLAGVILESPTFNLPNGIVMTQTAASISGKLGVALSASSSERVGIYLDDVYQGTATLNGVDWSFNLSGLEVGNHIVTAQVESSINGSVRLAQSQTIGIAPSTAPTTLAYISTMTDDEGLQKGTVSNNNSTDDRTLSLAGSLSTKLNPGDVVQVLDGTNVLGTATVSSTGTDWTFTTPALAYQSHSLTAKVVNTTTGLAGTASAVNTVHVQNPAFTFSVDSGTLSQSPNAVRYVMLARDWSSGAYLAVNEIEVMSGGVNVALGKTTSGVGWGSAVRGEMPASAAVDGSTFWGSAYLYNDNAVNGIRYLQVDLGDFYQIDSIKFTTSSEYGTLASSKVYFSGNSMTHYQSELSLNASPDITLAGTLTKDLVQTLDAKTVKFGSSYSTDNTPILSGALGTNLDATERLAVYADGKYLGNATITNASNGAWTFTVPAGKALSASAHSFMARLESLDGSIVKATAVEWLSIPGAAPTGNVNSALDSVVAGPGSLEVIGNLTSPLAAGQKLGVYEGTVLLGYATVSSNTWKFNQTGFGLGTHVLSAKVTDELGNVGAAGTSQSVTVTGNSPTQFVTVSGGVETAGAFTYTGHLLPGQSAADPLKSLVSTDTTPGVWGVLSSSLGNGESLVAYDGGLALAGTMVVNGKSWNFVPTNPLSEGFHSLTFRVEQGTQKGASSKVFGVEIDAVVDNFATILTLNDNQGALTGNMGNGGSTDDVFLEMNGKLEFAQEGTIKVFDGSKEIALKYAAQITDDSYYINIPQLGVGSHTLSVKFFNANGIEQTSLASTQTVNVVVGDSGQIASMTTSASGVDTLKLSSHAQTMDFTKLGTSTIDKVDLGNFGGNVVKLSTADVLDAGTNLFNTAGGWTFSNAADSTHAATYHQMVMDGSGSVERGNSLVTLTESAAAINTLSPWALTGTASHAGSNYNVYTNVVTDNVQLLINQNLAVSSVLI